MLDESLYYYSSLADQIYFLLKLPHNFLNRQPLKSILRLLDKAIHNPALVEYIQIVAFVLLCDFHYYPPYKKTPKQ